MSDTTMNHESAGTAYDPDAIGHELAGRRKVPKVHFTWEKKVLCGIRAHNRKSERYKGRYATADPKMVTCSACKSMMKRMIKINNKTFVKFMKKKEKEEK